MKKQFLLVAALAFVFSCESKQDTAGSIADTTETEMTETSEVKAEAENAHANWNDFFADFQAAVKADDYNKLESMTSGQVFSPEFVEDYYQYFFEGEAKNNFLAQKAGDAEEFEISEDSVPGVDFNSLSDGKMIVLHYVQEEFETESSKMYFFAKINGVYKLVDTMIAG